VRLLHDADPLRKPPSAVERVEVAGGDDHRKAGTPRAGDGREPQPVHAARHGEVGEHGIHGGPSVEDGERRVRVGRLDDPVAAVAQGLGQRGADQRVVLRE
jgi:hypothetical protein